MLKVSRILLATPPPMEAQRAAIYYHGIRHCDEALAQKILQEGLKDIPSDFWGDTLKPQDAVYMTKHLGTAIAYTGGQSQVDGWVEFTRERLYEGYSKLYVAQVDGVSLQANIEVDEDELDNLLDTLCQLDLEDLGPEEAELITLWESLARPLAKELIPRLTPKLTYWLLEDTRCQNLAHHGPVPVTCIYVWDLKQKDSRSNLRKSYAYSKPVGAEIFK